MLKRTSLLLGVLCLTIFHVGYRNATRSDPPGVDDLQIIGIALTANYATVTRRCNGTFQDLGRIEAQDEYVEMIQRMSTWDAAHLTPPYGSMQDLWDDWPRQIIRSARRRIGLPASSDVGIISRLVTDILDLVAESNKSAVAALISFPALRGLYQEDMVDVMTYLGLYQIRYGYQEHPHELVGAFAGNGLGLNRSVEDSTEFPVRPTLLVEYTDVALLLHHSWKREAIEVSWPYMQLQMSFEMGSNQNPDEEDILEFILRFLYDEYVKQLPPPVPEKVTVLVTGSASSLADGKVERAARKAVAALGSEIDIFTKNPEYTAAQGAAELAWRAMKLGKAKVLRKGAVEM